MLTVRMALQHSTASVRCGVLVWLNEAVQPVGLARFLSLAAGEKDPCLALTETTLVF